MLNSCLTLTDKQSSLDYLDSAKRPAPEAQQIARRLVSNRKENPFRMPNSIFSEGLEKKEISVVRKDLGRATNFCAVGLLSLIHI